MVALKILICSDKFKGSLSSAEVNQSIRSGILQTDSKIICITQNMSDGGDGFLDSITISNCSILNYPAIDSYGNNIKVLYANKKIYIELARVIGLVHEAKPSIWNRSSYPLGRLIYNILNSNLEISHIIIGLGGSSTNDAGFGALAALGVKFYTKNKELISKFTPVQLPEVDAFDIFGIHPKLNEVQIELVADVTGNLLGKHGCTYLFAGQKGAATHDLAKLEAGISNLQKVILGQYNIDIAKHKYGLCSGGIAAGLSILPKITCYSGAKWVIQATNLEEKIIASDYIVSGEGMVDQTTLNGKLIYEIGHLCRKHKKPLIIIAGQINCDLSKLHQIGITSAFSIINKILPANILIENAAGLVSHQAVNVFSLIRHTTPVYDT